MIKYILPLLTTTVLSLLPYIAQAQTYRPSDRKPQTDNSIGTIVTESLPNNFNITGGLRRGQNLFHSFTDFSIPTGGAANFTNPQGNQSIITRVTGSLNFFSDINGTLNTNGANFLLINPNGVVFGPGVSLNVGKAFVTSTASGVDFVDAQGVNYNFGVNRQGDPLLSIAPDVAFNPARLTMNASIPGSKGIENYGILETSNSGKYIGLIGGDIAIKSGGVVAPGGRVDLGGLNSVGTVTTDDQGLVFGGNNLLRSDVSLTNGAQVTVRVDQTLTTVNTFLNNAVSPGGSININANNVRLINDNSTFNTFQSSLDAGLAKDSGIKTVSTGDIKINASGRVILDNANIKNTIRPNSQGQIGNIKIEADSLEMVNGSIISSVTGGIGDRGFSNQPLFEREELGLDINKSLIGSNDRIINSTSNENMPSLTAGKGNAGNINIKINGNISISGTNDKSRLQGNEDESLSVISSATFGEGNAGKIKIDSQGILSMTNRSGIFAAVGPEATGNSQIIEINADSLNLNNISLIQSVNDGGTGNAGSIKINTKRNVNIQTRSQIASGTKGQGTTGNISISTAQLTLNYSDIGAIANSVSGGNITIGINDRLLLKNSSKISSTSGIFQGRGNGGNITINSPIIVALPGNNDITANAYQGKGGQVNITSQGLFGIQSRPKGQASDRSNDITASSDFNQQGTVDIKTPGIDPGKDTGELPAVPNDPSNQISQACSASQRENKFYITGRGGLPPNASEPQESEALWQDAREVKTKPATTASQPPKFAPPAIGWVFQKDGRVRLIAAQTGGGATGTKVVCPSK
jgi:filamentous hemagglutinin family protein